MNAKTFQILAQLHELPENSEVSISDNASLVEHFASESPDIITVTCGDTGMGIRVFADSADFYFWESLSGATSRYYTFTTATYVLALLDEFQQLFNEWSKQDNDIELPPRVAQILY